MIGIKIRGEQYDPIELLGSGAFGTVVLIQGRETGRRYAVKYIDRRSAPVKSGLIEREILNHISLRHPNVIRFRQLVLTARHLAIVMEYAEGGPLSDKIINERGLREDEARKYFQQLICGVSYCHHRGICHRDLKPNNILWNEDRLKICDFGDSKSSELHSTPHTVVGTPLYMAPEVFANEEYDGQVADAWCCGAILYAILSGKHAFPDRTEPRNEEKTSRRVKDAVDSISANVSQECKDLLGRLLVINPQKRITCKEIKNHSWFLKDLPEELTEAGQDGFYRGEDIPYHIVQEIVQIIKKAKTIPPALDSENDSCEDISNLDLNRDSCENSGNFNVDAKTKPPALNWWDSYNPDLHPLNHDSCENSENFRIRLACLIGETG